MPEIEMAFFRGVIIEKTSMYYSQLNTTKMLRGSDPIAGTVKITKLDLTNKLASGTFSVKLHDGVSKIANLTEGVFRDIPVK
jgi:hypothetical protein